MKKWNATASFALIQISTSGFYAGVLGYTSNFLRHHEFQDAQISLLLGLATALACFLQLGLAEMISRSKNLSVFHVLICMGILMLFGSAAMLTGGCRFLAVCGIWICCAILQAIPAMANAIGMDSIEQGSPTDFGIARGCGSFSYSVYALLTGNMIERFGIVSVAVICMVVTVFFLISVVWYHFCGEIRNIQPAVMQSNVQKKANGESFLKSYPKFSILIIGCIALYIAHNLSGNFLMQIVQTKGGGSGEQGIAASIAAIVELPVMFGFFLFLRWMDCGKWVQISTVFFVAKALGLYLSSDCTGVYFAQASQAFGYPLLTLANVHFAEKAVGKGEAIRAQSYLASADAFGGLFASFTGGVLCQFLGVQSMLLTAAAIAAAGAIIVIYIVPKLTRHNK